MGLDWNPAGKPRPGHEAEFWRLFDALGQDSCPDLEAKQQRFHEIAISAFETLRAPRIGIDPEATEWARQRYSEQKAEKPLEAWLADLHGIYVVPLVRPCDGVPRYTNGSVTGYVEPYSFRAQFLVDAEYILGTDLLNEGWEHKRPAQLRAHGLALRKAAITYGRQHGIEVLAIKDPEDPDTVEFHLDVILAASRWCLFWAAHGHPLEAYW